MNNDEIAKFLDGAKTKVKHGLDNLTITGEQARHASVMGQMGGAAGTLGGAVIGTGIGALTRHPAQGAGIGAMAGGALGAGTGSALGVYSGRKKPKKPALPQPEQVGKAFDETKHRRGSAGKFIAQGALAAGGVGAATGSAMMLAGHNSAKLFDRKVAEKLTAAANERKLVSQFRGTREASEHIRQAIGHTTAAIPLQGSADAARALKASGKRTALLSAGATAAGLGLAAAVNRFEHKDDDEVTKSFLHPTDQAKHKAAQIGLAGATVADAAGASAAWKETRNAVKPALSTIEGVAPKVKAIAGYAKEKAAFPIVAGGIAATALAEHELKSTQPKPPKQLSTVGKRFDSAEEIFAKARAV